MNRLGRYDVDAAFDRMSLQTVDEFGLDAILEQLVRAADVEGVRRLIEVSTPEGYRVPAACLRAAQQTAYAFDSVGLEKDTVLARSACYSDPMVVGEPLRGLDGLLESVKEWYESTGRVMPSVQRLTHGGAWPCFEWLLTVVNTGGSVRAWRAEQARELLFLKRLVKRARDRKRARAELTMTHRLFLLRDDALFLRCLEYCWFVDTERRLRCAGAE